MNAPNPGVMHNDTGLSKDEGQQESRKADVALEKKIGPPEQGNDFGPGRLPGYAVTDRLAMFTGRFGDQFNFVAGFNEFIGKNSRHRFDPAHPGPKGIGGEKNLHRVAVSASA